MGSVIKGYKYRLVDNRSFDIPLPVRFELLKEDDLVAFYEVSPDEQVIVRTLTKHKENMLTPIHRPLEIADMYYFFSTRVFQDGTPFTAMELQLIGLERYNAYNIIRKTRGVTPYDNYWLRFEGDRCSDYLTARSEWEELISHVHPVDKSAGKTDHDLEHDPFYFPGAQPFVATSTRVLDSEEESHVSDILSQHKMNFSERLAEESENTPSAAENEKEIKPVAAEEEIKSATSEEPKPAGVANTAMSIDEIDALLQQAGIGGDDAPAPKAAAEPAPAEEPKSSGGMMSDDEIAKMLAAASAPEPEAAAEPAPAEEPKSSGGMMSDDEIAKMLATASAPEPEAAAEPVPAEEPKSSGGKMSQDDIEKMLASASAPEPEAAAEPAPAEEPKSSGGKMNQDDIEKMLAAASAPEPEAAAEPAPAEEPKSSGGKMSQDDIEKMLAAASAPEPEAAAEPAPAEEPKSSGATMSEADIEALLKGMADDAGQ